MSRIIVFTARVLLAFIIAVTVYAGNPEQSLSAESPTAEQPVEEARSS